MVRLKKYFSAFIKHEENAKRQKYKITKYKRLFFNYHQNLKGKTTSLPNKNFLFMELTFQVEGISPIIFGYRKEKKLCNMLHVNI